MEAKISALTLNHVNAGLAAGTTTTMTVGVAPLVSLGGKFGTTTLSASANQAITPTLDAVTGVAFAPVLPNTCAAIVFGVNAAGTMQAVQGAASPTNAGVTTTVGTFLTAPQWPAIPDTMVPMAYTIVRAAPSLTGGFIAGSTQWAASGASCTTFANISTLPDRPQVA